jgi:hypothetical protein
LPLRSSVYVDGEAAPSLAYAPAAAAGMGLLNTTHVGVDVPPWGTPLMGSLGRASYYNTFRVSFQVSVAVTFQAGAGQPNGAIHTLKKREVGRVTSGMGFGPALLKHDFFWLSMAIFMGGVMQDWCLALINDVLYPPFNRLINWTTWARTPPPWAASRCGGATSSSRPFAC